MISNRPYATYSSDYETTQLEIGLEDWEVGKIKCKINFPQHFCQGSKKIAQVIGRFENRGLEIWNSTVFKQSNTTQLEIISHVWLLEALMPSVC